MMAKAGEHAKVSAQKFGGRAEDYIEIHEKMDSTKIAYGKAQHRCVFHSTFGIFLIEDIFGRTIKNSDNQDVYVRDIAEQHVLEDLGFIPSLSDWLEGIPTQPWMAGVLTRSIEIVDDIKPIEANLRSQKACP